ncbi:MAG: electron transfer flavoprotein subunit beta/FixA family protein [Anaerolineales bacterium]
MSDLKIIVCMKVVPKPEEVGVDKETMRLDRENARSEMNPIDMNALEMALDFKDRYGGSIDIVSMGPPFFSHFLPVGLAMGAKHIYLLSDRRFGGADTLATTYTLAQGIRKIGDVDLIFCGEESSDGATGHVPPGLAEWLDINQITMVNRLDFDNERQMVRGQREIPSGHQIVDTPLPVVISVATASNEPRFMDYRLKPWAFEDERITVWTAENLEVDPGYIGEPGSPTIVSGLEQAPSRERRMEFIDGTPDEIALRLAGILEHHL